MAPDKLKPNDPRVEHHTITINNKTYHYLLANPSSPPRATILLIHGWPDLSLGWRYQIPYLLSLGLRIIIPDMLGYGRTAAPESLEAYSFKSMSSDMMQLATAVTCSTTEPIVLGGHDWGGAVVWRIALWYPRRIRAVFSVCTPYAPPQGTYMSLEDVVKRLPNFRYQLHLAGPEVEAVIVGKDALRHFINGLFGGRGPKGEMLFSSAQGVLLEDLGKIGQSPLLSPEETEFYVQEYSRNGMMGPLNWYRTRKVNYEEELELLKGGEERTRITAPSLFISATKDESLPPWMAAGMDAHFENLVKKEVEANHWALVEAAEEVNGHIGRFLDGVLGGDGFRASI
jgi:soluble epoxide hydrolase/lipid-phosphate phosphatase